jgi:hypothetical protein
MTTEQIAELEADSKDPQLYIPATTLVRLLEERKQLLGALRWTSGSADFGPGGIAEEGWKNVVAPTIAYAEEEAP